MSSGTSYDNTIRAITAVGTYLFLLTSIARSPLKNKSKLLEILINLTGPKWLDGTLPDIAIACSVAEVDQLDNYVLNAPGDLRRLFSDPVNALGLDQEQQDDMAQFQQFAAIPQGSLDQLSEDLYERFCDCHSCPSRDGGCFSSDGSKMFGEIEEGLETLLMDLVDDLSFA